MFFILLIGVFIDGEGILNLQNGAYTGMIITYSEEHDPDSSSLSRATVLKQCIFNTLAFCYLCSYCCTVKKEKSANESVF
jgi:hypothetical protein